MKNLNLLFIILLITLSSSESISESLKITLGSRVTVSSGYAYKLSCSNARGPVVYHVEGLPEPKNIKSKFGTFSCDVQLEGNNTVIFKRTLELNKGDYPKEEYKAYRSFRRKIVKADKASFLLVKD